jgi:ubiquitin-protein ligase E3 C
MAYLSPRLGILNNIPFTIPFVSRVSIFRSFIANDKLERRTGIFESHQRESIVVRRNRISQDGFDHLNDLSPEGWKGRLQIRFIDQWGQEEAGIDGGGVFKEFLTAVSKEVFDTDRGLWLATTNQELYPNPHSYAKEGASAFTNYFCTCLKVRCSPPAQLVSVHRASTRQSAL